MWCCQIWYRQIMELYSNIIFRIKDVGFSLLMKMNMELFVCCFWTIEFKPIGETFHECKLIFKRSWGCLAFVFILSLSLLHFEFCCNQPDSYNLVRIFTFVDRYQERVMVPARNLFSISNLLLLGIFEKVYQHVQINKKETFIFNKTLIAFS